MHFSIVTVIAVLSASVAAVDISGAPECMQTCLIENQDVSECDPDAVEYDCFCADQEYYNAVQPCVLENCSTADALASLSWYNSVCPS